MCINTIMREVTEFFAPSPKFKVVYRASRFTHKIDSTGKAEKFFRKMWNMELINVQEEFYVIFVDDDNVIIEWMLLHKGGGDVCRIDVRLLFNFAFKFNASGIFVAHNHTKGTLIAYDHDTFITDEVKELSDRLHFRFLDHIIITDKGYYSFHESGEL